MYCYDVCIILYYIIHGYYINIGTIRSFTGARIKRSQVLNPTVGWTKYSDALRKEGKEYYTS